MDLPDKSQGAVPKKVINKTATGAKQVKRPATKRFYDFIFSESPKAMGKKVGKEVVVPQMKQGFQAAAMAFLNGMLWGNPQNTGQAFMQGTMLRPGMTNYQSIGTMPMNNMQMAQQAVVQQSSGNYQDLILPSQDMAQATLAQMYALLNEYRVVAVADLYEMVDGIIPSISDNAYGWTNLDGSRISAQSNGFLLQLPRPHQIN